MKCISLSILLFFFLSVFQAKSQMERPAGIHFAVQDVPVADSLLPTVFVPDAIRRILNSDFLFIAEEQKNEQVSTAIISHNLVATIHEAYRSHRPLVLSPEAIWLTISQGVSIHIDMKIDSLEHIIFEKNKPSSISLRNDELTKGSADWQKLIRGMSEKVQEYAKDDVYNFFVPHFSTTQPAHQVAFELSLLNSFKKIFKYNAYTLCGIPSITLRGEKEDWIKIKNRLPYLNQLGLKHWNESLSPVIDEFINVYDGKIDTKFWSQIYKDDFEYDRLYITGWIIKFYPYLGGVYAAEPEQIESAQTEEENNDIPPPPPLYEDIEYEVTVQNVTSDDGNIECNYSPNPFLQGNDYLLADLSPAEIPSGITEVNIKWHIGASQKEVVLKSGFIGIKQYEDKSIEPFISWAVIDKTVSNKHKTFQDYKKLIQAKAPIELIPRRIVEDPAITAIYDSLQFENNQTSIGYIKEALELAIKKQISNFNPKNIEVSFVILRDGSLTRIKIESPVSGEVISVIRNFLEKTNGQWTSAQSTLNKAFYLRLFSNPNETIPINSKIKISLFDK